jgi:hypothetical protein
VVVNLFRRPGLPDVYFHTKNPNLGKFWMFLEWKMLVNFMAICNILGPFGIMYGRLVYFMTIWNILGPLGIMFGRLVYFMTIWNILGPFGIF